MADYYSILNKTISGLAQNSPATRNAVYGKARTAIDRQLRAIEPTPSEEAILRQLQLLEDAIEKLDGEYQTPEEAAGPQTPDPEAVAPIIPSQAPVDTPIQSGVKVASPTSPPTMSPDPIFEDTPSGAPEAVSPSVTPQQGDPRNGDPKGMAYSETILAAEPDTHSSIQSGENGRKGGFLSMLLPILLAIGVIGGGLYALWINKDALMKGILGEESAQVEQPTTPDNTNSSATTTQNPTSDTEQPQQPGDVRVVGGDAPKNSTQLTPQGETVVVAPSSPQDSAQDTAQLDTTSPVQGDPAQSDPAPGDPAQSETAQTEPVQADPSQTEPASPDTPIEEPTAPSVTVVDDNTPTQQPVSTSPAVAQKAFLYEEGASGSNASRDNAAIIWSLDRQANDAGIQEAVIRGQLDVPGRNLSMQMLIKRNGDNSLPASHIIELEFKIPEDFTGGSITNVTRFMMKASEQGRGEGLVAVPAKISDGNFLIALNNLDQALVSNRKLMLESAWIDVLLGYTTGRRALVTLEKGVLGQKVFKDAFADWDKL